GLAAQGGRSASLSVKAGKAAGVGDDGLGLNGDAARRSVTAARRRRMVTVAVLVAVLGQRPQVVGAWDQEGGLLLRLRRLFEEGQRRFVDDVQLVVHFAVQDVAAQVFR